MLRLAQDYRGPAQEPFYRAREAGLSVRAQGSGLQPGEDAQFGEGGGGMLRGPYSGSDASRDQDFRCFSRPSGPPNRMGSLPIPQINVMAAKSGVFSTAC